MNKLEVPSLVWGSEIVGFPVVFQHTPVASGGSCVVTLPPHFAVYAPVAVTGLVTNAGTDSNLLYQYCIHKYIGAVRGYSPEPYIDVIVTGKL